MSKKQVIGVFCTDADLKHPKLIEVLLRTGLIKQEDLKPDGTPELSEEKLQIILHHIFGFNKGWYEKELIHSQKTFLTGETVTDSYRYVGTERQDKDWLDNVLCSQETREIVKWGTVL